MAENMNNSKISLKSLKKAVVSSVYTLKSPNLFIQLSDYPFSSSKRDSPSFEFANATFHFQLECQYYEDDGSKTLSVHLVRSNYEIKQQRIVYAISLLTANETDFDETHSVYCFDETKMKARLGFYVDEESFSNRYDTLTLNICLTCHKSTEGDDAFALERDVGLLSSDFKKLLTNGYKYDLTLRVGGKKFRVHQDILMARSQVFEAMLSHNMMEKRNGVVDVPDCDSKAMEQFLLYVYSGNVEDLNEDNVRGVYYLADKYDMTILKERCSKYIVKSLSPTTICDIIQFASNHNDTVLLDCATEYFVSNTSDIFSTVEWKSFLMSNVDAANELLLKSSKKWAGKS